jgi:hypothetical protein
MIRVSRRLGAGRAAGKDADVISRPSSDACAFGRGTLYVWHLCPGTSSWIPLELMKMRRILLSRHRSEDRASRVRPARLA